MIQKQLLEQAGRFRPDLTSSEDYDMWIRIAALQPRFTRVHQALTHKRIRRTSIQGSQTKKELIRNLLIALDANKDIFVSQLGITEKQYEQYIGYNLGFLGRSFRMPVYCFLCTTNRGLGAMYRYVQRYLLKRTETPFYEGQLF